MLLVEDNPEHADLMRKAVALLNRAWNLVHCETGTQALELIAQNDFDFSLAVVDLGLPDMGGLDVVRTLRKRFSEQPVLVVSSIAAERSVLEAIRTGASGYLLKDGDAAVIARAITQVLEGNTPISPSLARHLFKLAGSPQVFHEDPLGLTNKELETLRQLGRGHSYAETASLMGVSVSTVQTHVRSLYRKLGAHSKTQALVKGRENGLI